MASGRFITQPKVDALLNRLNQISQANTTRINTEHPITTPNNTTSNPIPTVDTIGINRQRLIMQKFTTTLTKHGMRRDTIASAISTRLAMKYGRPDALALAIDTIRPVVRYHKEQVLKKTWIPMALPEDSSIGLGIRWVLGSAQAKEYYGSTGVRRRELERSVEEELNAILDGSSGLFAKRAQFHKNPN